MVKDDSFKNVLGDMENKRFHVVAFLKKIQ